MQEASTKRLENQVALITGGGRGIGRAIARIFAKEGANIVIAELNLEGAQETAKIVETLGSKTLIVKSDVSKTEDVLELTEKAYEAFERVDILVNNAGVFPTGIPLIQLPEDVFDQCIAINLRGTFLCSKYLGKKMLRQKKIPGSDLRGKIINISSMAGKEGFDLSSAYSASKFGIIGLTQSMAKEVAPRMTVNAICPGLIKTPLWGRAEERLDELPETWTLKVHMKRIGTPEDVAPLALFLASTDSDYITGQAFNVTGGIIFH